MNKHSSYLDSFKEHIIETIEQYPGLRTYLVNYIYPHDNSKKIIILIRLWSIKEDYELYSIMNQLSNNGQTYQEYFEEIIMVLSERLHAEPVFDIRYI